MIKPKNNLFFSGDSDGYRTMVREFLNRRKSLNGLSLDHLDDPQIKSDYKKNNESQRKDNNNKKENENNNRIMTLVGVPHVNPIEISQDSLVAGTDKHYLSFVHAEWKNINVTLRRNTYPDCKDAIKADLEILSYVFFTQNLMINHVFFILKY